MGQLNSGEPLSVEEALRELREMFAPWDGQIVHRATTTADGTTFQIIVIDFTTPSDMPCKYNKTSPSLNEAMAQVRAWKESQ